MKSRIVRRSGILAALVATAIGGCGPRPPGASGDGAKPAVETPKPVPVTIAPLEHRTIERTIDAIGTLRGWEQVTVGSKRTGRVVKVLHDMGDRIEPGESLVELEPVDARLAMDEAESKYLGALVKLGVTRKQAEDSVKIYGITEDLLTSRITDEAIARSPAVVEKRISREKAQQNLARQRALTQRGAGTAQELDDAENDQRTAVAAYDNAVFIARVTIAEAYAARIALNKAEQQFKDMTIRAPYPDAPPAELAPTGKMAYSLSRKEVSEGQIIKEGEAVADLVIEDPLRLWSRVPEIHVEAIRVGQDVRVTSRAHPRMTFQGRVARISPSVDPSTRTFQVETLVPNRRGLLRPGGLARASIVVEAQSKAAVVPIESVVHFAGVTKVFLVDNGKAKALSDIRTGVEGRGWVEIVGERLPAAGDVVTSGQSHLADGSPIVVRKPE